MLINSVAALVIWFVVFVIGTALIYRVVGIRWTFLLSQGLNVLLGGGAVLMWFSMTTEPYEKLFGGLYFLAYALLLMVFTSLWLISRRERERNV